ncbi:MAG: hypothetical protein JWM11_1413 [Planctomycetaceae bacterium]|nr:hypothetical protein [Planctomycetaceae bacterium]
MVDVSLVPGHKTRFLVIGKIMFRLTQLLAFTFLLLAANSTPAGAAELEKALKLIPQSANSLAIIQVKNLVNSPLGQREGWGKKHQTQFLSGAVHIPPSVNFVLRGFEFHPEDTRVTKSYGIAGWQTPVSMSRIAEHEKARMEMIVGHAAVHTDRNSCFAELMPGLVGAVSPDYRQDLARWLREIDSGTVNTMSPFLQEVAANSGDSQVVLALDFQDLIDPRTWREHIKASSAVADKPNAVATLTHLTDSLRGISLKIHVSEKTTAVITLDFNTVVSQVTKPFLKPVLMDLLNEAGANLEDLADGEVEAKEKKATITFPLSDAGLRQVMSLILMPSLPGQAPESTAANDSNTNAPGANQPSLPATRTYYAAVNQILDDLEKQNKKGVNYIRTAVWHENFAKKIDQLSLRGVDPDLVSYGANVSSNLRALAVSLRGVPIEVSQLQGGVQYNVQYRPEGYYSSNNSLWSTVAYQPAFTNVQTNQGQIRAQQAEAIAAGAKQREKIWQIILDNRQQIRIKLTEKYGREFEAK